MGLKVKRFKKKTEDWISSHVQKYITNQTGHDIPFAIDWESFGDIEDAELLLKRGLSYNILESNVKQLCSDELGKEAFHEQVSSILVRNIDQENAEEMSYALEDGKLVYLSNQKQRIYGASKPMYKKLEDLFE